MKIAIPSSGTPALKKVVHAHVATAPYFLVLDTDSGVFEEVPNPNRESKGGGINPVGVVRDLKVDVLICAGLGQWALELIEAGGTKVFLAHGGTVESAIEDFKSGKLKRASR